MTVDEGTRAVTPGRAAQELELRRDEFRLAVQLGVVRTVPTGEGGRRHVERCELDRLRGAPDFPVGLRDRVRTVGTGEAAALLSITPERFTRLARTGHLSPVRFALNRYRAVVWTYLAEEVSDFGRRCPALLTGRLPLDLRERLAAHEDRRPRNWRARRLGLLLRATDDPWARAAAIASLLDPVQVAEVVDDPYERAHLDRLRPPPPSGMPVAAAAHELAERLTRADEPDEILWQRMSLALALDEARARQPAPYPGDFHEPSIPASAFDSASASASAVFVGAPTPSPSPVPVPVSVSLPSAAASAGSVSESLVPASAGEWAAAVGPGIRVRRVERTGSDDAPKGVTIPPLPSAPPTVPVRGPQRDPVPEPEPTGWRKVPDDPPGHLAAPDRPPGRPARTRLLDRLRRGKATESGRTRRRRGPVSWP
ncbi:DUF6397 family protein [Streptomyces sp. NPDC059534]|uniref:DUF6397 family protein n=1 Tax=Streptomyces sp. NPDC059534 TaxID=3346859 RepID=UPI0036AFD9DC